MPHARTEPTGAKGYRLPRNERRSLLLLHRGRRQSRTNEKQGGQNQGVFATGEGIFTDIHKSPCRAVVAKWSGPLTETASGIPEGSNARPWLNLQPWQFASRKNPVNRSAAFDGGADVLFNGIARRGHGLVPWAIAATA